MECEGEEEEVKEFDPPMDGVVTRIRAKPLELALEPITNLKDDDTQKKTPTSLKDDGTQSQKEAPTVTPEAVPAVPMVPVVPPSNGGAGTSAHTDSQETSWPLSCIIYVEEHTLSYINVFVCVCVRAFVATT